MPGASTPANTPSKPGTPQRPPSLASLARPADVRPRPPVVQTPSRPLAPAATPASQSIHRHAPPPTAASPPTGPSTAQRLERLFHGEPHYLETGNSNRLTLSLLSGQPDDVDFALARLLTTSLHEPEFLPFDKFPGLLEGLLATIRRGLPSSLHHPLQSLFEDRDRRHAHRRSLEAALVLRNLAALPTNHKPIMSSPRTLPLLLDTLDTFTLSNASEMGSELGLYVLETTEALAPAIQQISDPNGKRQLGSLSKLTQYDDRALVLGAFRTLAALGAGLHNRTTIGIEARPRGVLEPALDRALQLLALPDVDIVLPALDFIYTSTADHVVASRLCTESELSSHVLSLLSVYSRHRLSLVPRPVRSLPWPSDDWWWSSKAAKDFAAQAKAAKDEAMAAAAAAAQSQPHSLSGLSQTTIVRKQFDPKTTVLSESDLAEILHIPEPRRTMVWMRYVFEAEADAEVQQVDLWLAYKHQFEGSKVPIIMAQEVIKMSTDAFPDAVPMVTERGREKMFVIRGMKIRDRTEVFSFYACRWNGCEERLAGSATSLYEHILSTHLSSQPTQCHWDTCTFAPSELVPSPSPQWRRQLMYHIRTHIPIHHGPRVAKPPMLPKDQTPLSLNIMTSERWDVPSSLTATTANQNASNSNTLNQMSTTDWVSVGLGYTALLVLRNLVRWVSIALEDIIQSLKEGGEANPEGNSGDGVGGVGRMLLNLNGGMSSGGGGDDRRREVKQCGIFGLLVEAERNLGPANSSEPRDFVNQDGEIDDVLMTETVTQPVPPISDFTATPTQQHEFILATLASAQSLLTMECEMLRWSERDIGLVEVSSEILYLLDVMSKSVDTLRQHLEEEEEEDDEEFRVGDGFDHTTSVMILDVDD